MRADEAYKAGIRAHEVEIKGFADNGDWLVFVKGWDRPIGKHPNIFRCIQFRAELQAIQDKPGTYVFEFVRGNPVRVES